MVIQVTQVAAWRGWQAQDLLSWSAERRTVPATLLRRIRNARFSRRTGSSDKFLCGFGWVNRKCKFYKNDQYKQSTSKVMSLVFKPKAKKAKHNMVAVKLATHLHWIAAPPPRPDDAYIPSFCCSRVLDAAAYLEVLPLGCQSPGTELQELRRSIIQSPQQSRIRYKLLETKRNLDAHYCLGVYGMPVSIILKCGIIFWENVGMIERLHAIHELLGSKFRN